MFVGAPLRSAPRGLCESHRILYFCKCTPPGGRACRAPRAGRFFLGVCTFLGRTARNAEPVMGEPVRSWTPKMPILALFGGPPRGPQKPCFWAIFGPPKKGGKSRNFGILGPPGGAPKMPHFGQFWPNLGPPLGAAFWAPPGPKLSPGVFLREVSKRDKLRMYHACMIA